MTETEGTERTPRYSLYQMVRVRGRPDLPPTRILDFRYPRADGEILYQLRWPDGTEREVPESEIEATGDFDAPFYMYEVVEVHPDPERHPESYEYLSGQKGVVVGVAVDDADRWWFGVSLQDGIVWYFREDELRRTGYMVPQWVIDLEKSGPRIRVRVDPRTGRGKVVGPRPRGWRRGPVPWPIDLADPEQLEPLRD